MALTYLTMDPVQCGVGASQVLPYVRALAERGLRVKLVSFEPEQPRSALAAELRAAAVDWRPHRFGRPGAAGGAGRIARAASAVARAPFVHARSDLAATAALAARARRWVWDVRSFWVDQRLAMGIIREGSRQERFFRAVERRAAIRSSGIITLTRRAVEEIERKYGEAPAAKATVITTCVDLERFAASALPAGPPRLLMSGTFNALYDIDLMLRFFGRAREALGADLTVLRPEPAPSDSRLRHCGAAVGTATYQDMPEAVSAHHVGLSLCRRDQPRALRGAMPTKIGEFLACGRPVVVSPGIGDLDVLISASRTGVIVQGGGDGDLALACHQLKELLDDPDLPRRCRALAERHFDLARGIDSMIEVYRRSGLEV